MKKLPKPQIGPEDVLCSYISTVRTAKVRPPGYLAEFVARPGVRIINDGGGKPYWIIMPRSEWIAHMTKWGMPGVGDHVARFAKPIARAIDAVAGTNLTNCGGCHDRQQRLNEKFPSADARAGVGVLPAAPAPQSGDPSATAPRMPTNPVP